MTCRRRLILPGMVLGSLLALPLFAAPAEVAPELLTIQQEWAHANYQIIDPEQRVAAFASLSKRAAVLSQQNPGQAQTLVWEGIVLSSYAAAKGGLGALGLARQSRDKLTAALQIDPNALEGSAYTSLGVLYYKVPGFPLGFGDQRKANSYLQKALQLNPDGIDPNYFYGEFLFEQGKYADALQYLEKAMQAPPRPNRELADWGRRQEIATLISRARSKAG